MDIYFIINLAVCIIVGVLFLIFFKSRSNLRSASIYLVVIIAAVLLNYFNVDGKLQVAATIGTYAMNFMMILFCVIHQSSFKAINARINRPFRSSNLGSTNTDEELSVTAREIVRAVQNMAKSDTGALIIIAKDNIPEYIMNSGVQLDAQLSSGLLESIFNKKSPLHDGAVIVKENRVLATGCFLPLSQDNAISKDLGTRHRAAIGITEEANVLSIVVSEETGIISTVESGVIRRYITPEKLTEAIESAFGIVSQPSAPRSRFRR